jgi:hypothetical protein
MPHTPGPILVTQYDGMSYYAEQAPDGQWHTYWESFFRHWSFGNPRGYATLDEACCAIAEYEARAVIAKAIKGGDEPCRN